MDFAGTTYKDKINPFAKPLRTFFLVALTLFTIFPTSSFAAFYYVDQNHPNANDANPGTSESAPWKTLHRATDGVPSREQGGGPGTFTPVGPGDTVFVKNGTYTDVTATDRQDPEPKYHPTNSGTVANPIAFRAYTPPSGARHQPILNRALSDGENNPVVGNGGTGRNYIIWDGFKTAPNTDVRVQGCTGCIIEYMLIDKGPGTQGNGLRDGIRMELSTGVSLRNNTIKNIYYNDSSDTNASGIKLYDDVDSFIHNNEIVNCTAGIYDKDQGTRNIFEKNYIHDDTSITSAPGGMAIQIGDSSGVGTTSGDIVRGNIIVNYAIGVSLIDARDVDTKVYNNTLYSVDRGVSVAVHLTTLPTLSVYNNIIMRGTVTGSDKGHYYFNDFAHTNPDIPANLVAEYNLFYGVNGIEERLIPYSGLVENLTQWQMRGFDSHSLAVNPLFVGPFSTAQGFRLQAGSPARNAGRTNGVSSGVPVNMGAYISDSDVIGIQDPVPPDAPVALGVR